MSKISKISHLIMTSLMFVSSLVLLMLACLIPEQMNFTPIAQLAFYCVVPLPGTVAMYNKEVQFGNSYLFTEICQFLTGVIMMSSVCLPLVLLHVNTLQLIPCVLTSLANLTTYYGIWYFYDKFIWDTNEE